MTVYLVGAGPGDPELITVKGAALLARCDVVIYDALASPELLDLVPASAQRIAAGKRRSHHSLTQDQINALLVQHGRSTALVVRLKGGDPGVLGHLAEELQILREANIDVEVVPGITSAIGGPTHFGLPLTARECSRSVTIVSGHEDPDTDTAVHWEALATAADTLVILMATRSIAGIARRLIAGGRPHDEPCAVLESSTTALESIRRTSLGELEQLSVTAPATFVIGPVAAL